MDQYMEPGQDGEQDDQIIPTEVQADDRSRQTHRAVYRIDPHAAEKELRLEPCPDDQTDRTGARLSRPTRQAKTDGRAGTHLGRVEIETDHSLSLLEPWEVKTKGADPETQWPVYLTCRCEP
uniref:Uncharacterized protein n=1 Tax=Brassica oleracea var. oleracea TaxID=109376 RepID=A0A0D3CQ33_BRAOL